MKLLEKINLKGAPRSLRFASYASMGCFVGMGVYVANISQAASYLSDQPEACINCHIMTPQYASWKHSSHARVATCNDCHVPQDSTLRKVYFKMMDGGRHSAMFTLRMEPQVIKAREASVKVIQANCVRCHADQVHGATTEVMFSRNCNECHREVPHGRVNSLSSAPNAAVPAQRSVIPEWLRAQQKPKETQSK